MTYLLAAVQSSSGEVRPDGKVVSPIGPPDAWFSYSPIVNRPVIEWPDGARVALWVAPNIEFYEFRPPPNIHRRFYRRVPEPDVLLYSYCHYSNRVGFWRMLEVFDHYRLRATASLNVAVLEHFPEIRDAMVERNWDFMSHGIYNTRFLFGMSEEEERSFLRDNIEMVRRHTGKKLKGLFGPGASMTPRTMGLMAEEGLLYSGDWYIDDQPFPLNVEPGPLISVPYSWEINDGLLISYLSGRYEADYFLQICKDQFDTLYREGAQSGRVMCIALHPMCFGQPHRLRHLYDALGYILSHDGVWVTTADEIAEYYLANYYREVVDYVSRESEG